MTFKFMPEITRLNHSSDVWNLLVFHLVESL